MPNIYRRKLDIKNPYPNFKPVFVQYDHAILQIELMDMGYAYDLSNVERAEFTHVRSDNSVIIQMGEIVTIDGKELIQYEYLGSEMEFLGTVKTSIAVFDTDNKKVSSHTFNVLIVEDLRNEVFNPAQPNYDKLQTLFDDVEDLKQNPIGDTSEINALITNLLRYETVTDNNNVFTINFNNYPVKNVKMSLTDSTAKSIVLQNVPNETELFIELTCVNGASINWFSNIVWLGGVVPVFAIGKVYRIAFFTTNNGNVWHGTYKGGW